MKKFFTQFYHTLTTPEEWHAGSIIAVGIAIVITFSFLMGEAFDAQFLGYWFLKIWDSGGKDRRGKRGNKRASKFRQNAQTLSQEQGRNFSHSVSGKNSKAHILRY